jgi:hypothetical protein
MNNLDQDSPYLNCNIEKFSKQLLIHNPRKTIRQHSLGNSGDAIHGRADMILLRCSFS